MIEKRMKRSKRLATSGLFSIAVCIFFNLVGPSQAQDVISWSQLPYCLEKEGIPLKDLPLCDCPLGLNEDTPSHHVVQVIGNTLYEWREYEFKNSEGKVQLALAMLRPEIKRLNSREAQILLTASSGWHQPTVMPNRQGSVIAPPEEERQTRMPGNRIAKRTASSGEDTRIRVGDLAEQYPFNTIAFLDFLSEGIPYTGTGFLISATCVLTAGHNVYWPPAAEGDEWSSEMSVTPGQQQPDTGANLIRPYGSISSDDLYTNIDYANEPNVIEEKSEYDYGAIILGSTFPGLDTDTFMLLEFDTSPASVNVAGYPGEVRGEQSYDMWFAAGSVYGTSGDQNQIIDFGAFCSGGNSGSPIWYRHEATGENRVIGIVTWQDSTFDSGVRLTSLNKDLILEWLEASSLYNYNYTYYVPYFLTLDNNWTGLALANHNNTRNNIKIEYFSTQGKPVGSAFDTLEANGQTALGCTPIGADQGWIKVSSTLPLYGLALLGNSTPSTLFDMDLQNSLQQQFILPHLAADGQNWRSLAIMCNPNPTAATVTYTYYAQDGSSTSTQATIPAWGSLEDDLKTRFNQNLSGGHILIQSSQPLAGFLLYDSSCYGQSNWKGGLSAMPLQVQ